MRCEDHRLYITWKSMKTRCYNKNTNSYKNYGGRGIGVYYKWKVDFWCFVQDMYPSFEEGKTLDRVDNNRGYSPWNCRWASRVEQNNNQNREYTTINYKGGDYTEAELSRLTGIPRSTLQARRRRGWSDHEIVNGKENKKYKVKDKMYNLKELSEYLGSYPQQVIRRLRKKTLEEIVHEFRGI